MVRALIIGPTEETEIKAAVERARRRPILWDVLRQSAVATAGMVRLEDRDPRHTRPPRSEQVLIPIGYRFCVSFEQQPAGMLAHFSISVNKRNALPNPAAVRALLAAAGFDFDDRDRGWTEEFLVDGKPGGLAVNMLFMVVPTPEGHA